MLGDYRKAAVGPRDAGPLGMFTSNRDGKNKIDILRDQIHDLLVKTAAVPDAGKRQELTAKGEHMLAELDAMDGAGEGRDFSTILNDSPLSQPWIRPMTWKDFR